MHGTLFTIGSVPDNRGSRVKNPTKLATRPDKINGQLEKICRDPHLLTLKIPY